MHIIILRRKEINIIIIFIQDEINLHEKKLEKYKNYDKMVETVKTLNEENKYLEKRA